MWEFAFFRYAVLISIVLSLLFALVSFLIVTGRLSFLAVGTEHAAFGGMGLAHFMGWNPFLTTVIFCTTLTVFAGRSHSKHTDLGTSIFFSGAMAFGMLLLSFARQPFNLSGFLFGDLVGIQRADLILSLAITALVFIILIPMWGKIMFLRFDRETAIVAGVNAGLLDTLVYIVLSVSIILGIRMVGVLLVAAMTVLPAMFALLWKQNTLRSILIAFFYTLIAMQAGILLSTIWDLPPGVLIVLMAMSLYFVAGLGQRIYQKTGGSL